MPLFLYSKGAIISKIKHAIKRLPSKQNVNEDCNNCASLAGLVLGFIVCFIACFILLVIVASQNQPGTVSPTDSDGVSESVSE